MSSNQSSPKSSLNSSYTSSLSVPHFDVFNGDADGICALIQLRNAEPRDAHLISGVKRDINLLLQVAAESGSKVTVLDVSVERNIEGLKAALSNGAEVFYVDHHFPGDIPVHVNLTTIINEAPDVCTSLLVNGYIKGKFAAWAVTGAFGDNLKTSARTLGSTIGLSNNDMDALEKLGIYINYNGYGSSLDDLHFNPVDLYTRLVKFTNPLDFINAANEDYQRLENGYLSDMKNVHELKAHMSTDKIAVYLLPNQPWSHRVSGVYSNELANTYPDRAHGVLTLKDNGNYLVSVRAPLNNKQGAVDLCRQFPTGGGRAAAAGINDLPAERLNDFVEQLGLSYL